jgi:hypothetical protein
MTSQRKNPRRMTRLRMSVLQSNSDETFWMRFNHVGGHALRRRLVRLKRPRGPSWEEVGVQGLQCGSRKPKLDESEQFQELVDYLRWIILLVLCG